MDVILLVLPNSPLMFHRFVDWLGVLFVCCALGARALLGCSGSGDGALSPGESTPTVRADGNSAPVSSEESRPESRRGHERGNV